MLRYMFFVSEQVLNKKNKIFYFMEEEENLRQQIEEIKASIEEMKKTSKTNENELKQQVQVLEKEKQDLITGVKARMQLLDILKRDIARISYDQALKMTDAEHAKPNP